MAEIILEDAGWGEAFNLFILVLIVLVILLAAAFHRRVFFKMGLRNAARRPSQTSLVLIGLMVGTAILSGAFVAGDTMEFWIIKEVYETTDLVDETITISGGLTFNHSVYDELASDATVSKRTDGLSPILSITGITSINDNSGQTEPDVVLYGFEAGPDKDLGRFTTKDGKKMVGDDLAENETIMNERLANALVAKVGQQIDIYYVAPIPAMAAGGAGGPPAIMVKTLTIRHIVKNDGKANYNGANILYMDLTHVQSFTNLPDQINQIRVSNNGGVVDGAKGTGKATKAIVSVLDGLGPDSGATPEMFNIMKVKEEAVEISESSSSSFSDFLLMASSFTVATGVLLIINIFVMLAEERKRELGISRAVGMRRSYLVRGFLFEGFAYSLVASVVGTFLGVLIGWMLIFGMISGMGFGDVNIPFYFKNSSLLNAFSMGFLITVGTVALASWRVSKLNIVRAIRSISEPVYDRGTRKTLISGLALVAFGVFFTLATKMVGIMGLLGVVMMFFGLALVMRRRMKANYAYTFGGLSVLIFAFWFMLYGEVSGDEGMIALVVVGLLMVFGGVLALVSNSRLMVTGIGRLMSFSPRAKAVAEPAIGYPLNKGFRTGMTIAMFSLIIFIVLLFSIFFTIFTPDVSREGGGYDLMATVSVPVNDIENISFSGPGGAGQVDYTTLNESVAVIDPLASYGFWGNFYNNGTEVPTYGPPFHYIIGVDEGFSYNVKWSMSAKSKEYETKQQVWAAVANDPSLAIVDSATAGTHVSILIGDDITLPSTSGANTSRKYKVVGIVDELMFPGIFVQKESMLKEFPHVRGNNMFLIKVAPGKDHKQVAKDLESDFRVIGMNVVVLEVLLEAATESMESIFQMFELFLSLGLVVGIASLGVLSVRAVIERKHEIGIMRAIGYRKSMVMSAFVFEMLFVTSVGIILGVLIGYLGGYGIWKSGMEDLGVEFAVPWDRIGMIILMTYIAAVICTVLPAYKASRTNPAEAVRVVE